jgi:hypothetical protein
LKQRSARARRCRTSSPDRPLPPVPLRTTPVRRRQPSRPRHRSPIRAHRRFPRRRLRRLPRRRSRRLRARCRSALPLQHKLALSHPRRCVPRPRRRARCCLRCRRPRRDRQPRRPPHVRPCRPRRPQSPPSHRLSTPRRYCRACRTQRHLSSSRGRAAHRPRPGARQSRRIRCSRYRGCRDSSTTGSHRLSGPRPPGTSLTSSSRRICNPRRARSRSRIPDAAARPARSRHHRPTARTVTTAPRVVTDPAALSSRVAGGAAAVTVQVTTCSAGCSAADSAALR